MNNQDAADEEGDRLFREMRDDGELKKPAPLTAREVARELKDAMEHDNGGLFGDDISWAVLIAVVEQAMLFGWDVNAEDIVALAIGDEKNCDALIAKHPALAVVDKQLAFIFEQPNAE